MNALGKTAISWFILCAIGLSGCGYRLIPGPLRPLSEPEQGPEMSVLDDGSILYTKERFEVGLRPVTDEELNRQFAVQSKEGVLSTNPYTYGNWKPIGEDKTPGRFTVFLLSVKNYAYPKVKVVPSRMSILSRNGREYVPLSLDGLGEYYIKYAVGYGGNAYLRFEQRKDILKQTLFPKELILFSGQDGRGYVVFPKLDTDVREITVLIEDIVLRFDSWGRPVETLALTFRFTRDVSRREGS